MQKHFFDFIGLPYIPTFQPHILFIRWICVQKSRVPCKPIGRECSIENRFRYYVRLIDCFSFMYSMTFLSAFFICFIFLLLSATIILFFPFSIWACFRFLSFSSFLCPFTSLCLARKWGIMQRSSPFRIQSLDNTRHHFPVRSEVSELHHSQTVMLNIDSHNMHDCLS